MSIKINNKLWQLTEIIGLHFIDLLVSLLAMVIVARSFDLAGFGIYSYLVGVFHIVAFISEAGICDRFRNRYALDQDREQLLTASAGALLCTGLAVVIFFLITGVFDTSLTRIEERLSAYFLIAAAVPIGNSNRLRITLLHVEGDHKTATRLVLQKNLLFLGCIWLLSFWGQPSILVGSFLIAEVFLRLASIKRVDIPPIFRTSFIANAIQTVRDSLRHLFSGETFTLIFHADLFILGLFVTSDELGVYAEAALFARLFLLVPVALRPVMHRHFARLVSAEDTRTFATNLIAFRAYLFYGHSLLALFLTNYFSDILHLLLGFYGSEKISYDLFTLMLPGFLFYAAAIVNESALEASGNAPFLSQLSTIFISANVLFCFYLIPFAGIFGAAIASLLCLLIYFFTLNTFKITTVCPTKILEFLAAGSTVYLFHSFLKQLNLSLVFFAITVPPLLYLAFYLLNFFDIGDYNTVDDPHPPM
ncbi:MAG: lipopolysaccharide biosynthesis protein [Desulforhopalus sp.]